eukprot:MONOS_10515.1-p1 / transcript=MONOS_10515.1 / gene=MONOS_10515 / organism=Monocercomonoides_exilis_PA203 / gene_product=unspecified product / transcript_product=unspecified product / location=Mono_scaffold00481:19968-22160(-) / protein_length=699 / sequence_SO=supercontig / SO=protein_coding / is_pseudo=false
MAVTIPFGLLTPMLPVVVRELGGGNIGYASLLASYNIANFIGSLCVGTFSDFIGRKTTILICLVCVGIANTMLAFAKTIPTMIICRSLTGFFACTTSVAMTITSDRIPIASERTTWFGWYASCLGLGIALGPVIGGALSNYPLYVPCYVCAGFIVLALIAVLWVVKETLPKDKRLKCIRRKKQFTPSREEQSESENNKSFNKGDSDNSSNNANDEKQGEALKDGVSDSTSKQLSNKRGSIISNTVDLSGDMSFDSEIAASAAASPFPEVEQPQLSLSGTAILPSTSLPQNEIQMSSSGPAQAPPHNPSTSSSSPSQSTCRVIFSIPYMLTLINNFTSTFQYSAIQTFLPPLCIDRFGFSSAYIGYASMSYGIGLFIIQLVFIPLLVPRLGQKVLLISGVIVAALALCLLAFANKTSATVFVFCALFGLGQGFVIPTANAIFSHFGTPQSKGRVMGVAQCAAALSRTVAPIVVTFFYETKDYLAPVISGGVGVLGALLLIPVKIKMPSKAKGKDSGKKTSKDEESGIATGSESKSEGSYDKSSGSMEGNDGRMLKESEEQLQQKQKQYVTSIDAKQEEKKRDLKERREEIIEIVPLKEMEEKGISFDELGRVVIVNDKEESDRYSDLNAFAAPLTPTSHSSSHSAYHPSQADLPIIDPYARSVATPKAHSVSGALKKPKTTKKKKKKTRQYVQVGFDISA